MVKSMGFKNPWMARFGETVGVFIANDGWLMEGFGLEGLVAGLEKP